MNFKKGNLPAAVNFIVRAIKIDSNNAAYFSNRGVALDDLRRFDEALAGYDRALAIQPDKSSTTAARLYRKLKHFDGVPDGGTKLARERLVCVHVFPNDDESASEFAVAPLGGFAEGGCYLYTRNYVARLAKETCFSVALVEMDVHEI